MNLCEEKRQVKKGRPVQWLPRDSFFNFFKGPSVYGKGYDDAQTEEEIYMQLDADFELGLSVKERLIPEVFRWYTGEAVDEEDEEEVRNAVDHNGQVMQLWHMLPTLTLTHTTHTQTRRRSR